MAIAAGYKQRIQEGIEFFKQIVPDITYVDKYPESTVNSAFDKAIKSQLLSNNKKISLGKINRIKHMVLDDIRCVYGEYANILDLKIKKSYPLSFSYNLNFLYEYKTPQGRLYGIGMTLNGNKSGILVTTHALDRFKERTDFNLLQCIYGKDFTALDMFVAVSKDSKLLTNKNEMLILSKYGYFIIENNIVKTFLTYDMDSEYSEIIKSSIKLI